MANYHNFAMAEAIASHPNLQTRKSFFGLLNRLYYVPTDSLVESKVFYYTPDEGGKLEKLLSMQPEQLLLSLQQSGKPRQGDVGNVCAQVCVSADKQFLAVILLKFYDFSYHPMGHAVILEGDEAQAAAQLF